MSARAEQTGGAVAAKAEGVKQKATHLKEEEKPRPDDVTLARKVETEIFRSPDAPKGDVSVDVQGGIAHLRGVVADVEWADRLASEARNVEGIRGVENLLHEPGTPAPVAPPRGLVQERAD
jgi:osmotically-inducible protein OsmY